MITQRHWPGDSIHFERAREMLAQSRANEAAVELSQHLAQAPDDPAAHTLMAVVESSRGEPARAMDWIQRALKLDPANAYAHAVHGWLLGAAGKVRESEAALREALRLDPYEAWYYGLLARLLGAGGRWTESLECAEAGLTLDANDADCINTRAMALLRLGRKDNAEAAIQSALADDPENPHGHVSQGRICLNRGETDRALAHFREALRLDPELESARRGMLDALRSKYRLYRWIYGYYEWMQGFTGARQKMIVVGGYVAYRAGLTMQESVPALRPVIVPLLIAYAVFVFLSWTGRSCFDLLLRLNPLGRLALRRQEMVASNFVGASLVLGGLGIASVFVSESVAASVWCIFVALGLAIPASQTVYARGNRRPVRIVSLVVLYALVGAVEFLSLLVGGDPGWLMAIPVIVTVGVALYSWSGVFRRR